MMTAEVSEQCIGCGLCTCICGGVFRMNDSGRATARNEILREEEGMAREAAESCPVGAIHLEE